MVGFGKNWRFSPRFEKEDLNKGNRKRTKWRFCLGYWGEFRMGEKRFLKQQRRRVEIRAFWLFLLRDEGFIVFVERKTGDHWSFWKVWEKTQPTEDQTIFLEKRSFLEQSHETYIFSYFYDFASFFLQISLLIYCLLWTSRVVCSYYWICLYICMSCFFVSPRSF